LVAKDVNTLAVVIEDVEPVTSISVGYDENDIGTYVAERAKQIATPKKKVENTTMSAVDAVSYLGCNAWYTGIGRRKNSAEPIRCEYMLTEVTSQRRIGREREYNLTCFVMYTEDTRE
jgi:hypothetical protein